MINVKKRVCIRNANLKKTFTGQDYQVTPDTHVHISIYIHKYSYVYMYV